MYTKESAGSPTRESPPGQPNEDRARQVSATMAAGLAQLFRKANNKSPGKALGGAAAPGELAMQLQPPTAKKSSLVASLGRPDGLQGLLERRTQEIQVRQKLTQHLKSTFRKKQR